MWFLFYYILFYEIAFIFLLFLFMCNPVTVRQNFKSVWVKIESEVRDFLAPALE